MMRAWPRRWRWRIALALVALLILPTVSYLRALTYPGSATWQMRSADWVRDHGGAPIVNAVENWYYTRHKPSTGAPNAALLPRVPTGLTAGAARGGAMPPPLPLLNGVARLPGEAIWDPGRRSADGRPALYTAYFRPDGAHPSIVAGVAWMRAGASAGHLVAGTREPGGSSWPGDARVPPDAVPTLVATFNSGFKMRDIVGGFYQAGRTAGRLVSGQASLVIDDRGDMTVGQWGRDVSMNSHVAAVRQNLDLVVDGGKPVAGLSVNAHGRWGSAKNQYQYTWRSGVGIDAAGNFIYVAGNSMNLTTFAAAMADAGIVRGMQLDIHTGMASFAWWMPAAGGRSSAATKLLPAMTRPADRYLVPDQRDFVYLTLR
jgi:hypothetical protein